MNINEFANSLTSIPINQVSEANQIIAELLKENNIKYSISSGGLYIEFDTPIGRAHLYLTNNDGSPFSEAKCIRPDPANPNFIEDIKEFIECCSSNSVCIGCHK